MIKNLVFCSLDNSDSQQKCCTDGASDLLCVDNKQALDIILRLIKDNTLASISGGPIKLESQE